MNASPPLCCSTDATLLSLSPTAPIPPLSTSSCCCCGCRAAAAATRLVRGILSSFLPVQALSPCSPPNAQRQPAYGRSCDCEASPRESAWIDWKLEQRPPGADEEDLSRRYREEAPLLATMADTLAIIILASCVIAFLLIAAEDFR